MEQAVPFQPDNSEHGFSENTAVHLGCSQFAVDEDNRHFLYIRSAFVSGEFHFYLESIPFEADAVQIDGLQYLAAVAYKAGGSVMYGQSRDKPYIFGSEIRHQHTSHRPVYHIHAADVARADGHIGAKYVPVRISAMDTAAPNQMRPFWKLDVFFIFRPPDGIRA